MQVTGAETADYFPYLFINQLLKWISKCFSRIVWSEVYFKLVKNAWKKNQKLNDIVLDSYRMLFYFFFFLKCS